MAEQNPPPELPPWMPSTEKMDSPPKWDQSEADWLIGKIALVGITRLASDGTTIKSHGQYYGKIVRADRSAGIVIECEGVWSGKTMRLPPMTGVFHPANSGEYRLRSTGEIIKDPDMLATWSITEPVKS
jgi:hypothetical protein